MKRCPECGADGVSLSKVSTVDDEVVYQCESCGHEGDAADFESEFNEFEIPEEEEDDADFYDELGRLE